MAELTLPEGMEVRGEVKPGYDEILTPEALAFVAELERTFRPRRDELMARREEIQEKLDGGWLPDFLEETKNIRDGDWKVAPIPADLQDRRVEITGPVERKMVINALNSGARVFMADFEDSNAPTWDNNMAGHVNMRDAARGDITFDDPKSGKHYELGDNPAVLIVRPRGWHLPDNFIRIDGQPIIGGLADFGLHFFHNAKALIARGTGPYYYLPKLENHLEARLWNDVFIHAQDNLGLPVGTIKATVLIETIMAVFEMDEILYELRDHMAGLNCGRWDYIFSFIKRFRNRPDFTLPDRSQVTMTVHFLDSYSQELIRTCHRRGAFAMGGMAAQIPIKNDPEANDAAIAKVRDDKEREAGNGHDGTWVAHPGLVPVAMEVFDRMMPNPNQLARARQDVHVTAQDLLRVPEGTISEAGVRANISIGIQYTEAWLRGNGCVPIYNLMEDAATAEISRSQLWQWRKHGAHINDEGTDGPIIDDDLLEGFWAEELEKIEGEVGEDAWAGGKFDEASELFWEMTVADDFQEFLTLPAYERITADLT